MVTRILPGHVSLNPLSEPSQAQPSSLKHLKGLEGQTHLVTSALTAEQGKQLSDRLRTEPLGESPGPFGSRT